MGLDDMLKQQIPDRAPELKQKLVSEFDELTQKDMDEASDDRRRPGRDRRSRPAEDRRASRAGRAARSEGDAEQLTLGVFARASAGNSSDAAGVVLTYRGVARVPIGGKRQALPLPRTHRFRGGFQ